MKRTILISSLTTILGAAAMFAQSAPASSAPVTPQTSTTKSAPVSKKKGGKKAKSTTAKPVSSAKAAKTPTASSAPVKQ